MNGLNNSSDDVVECPLCMEPLEVDDLNFYPCTCGYQICRFCWHRIRTDENELCPACRKEYPENPADFTPLTQEEMIAFKSQKRQRDQQRKQKITENRKHLSNVRVVQRNLVFVVGLPPRLADADVLKKHEYFGKFGKIHKVVINPSTTYAGVQGPSASAYVTYVQNCDALRAIQSVNNIMIDGRLIKTSLGTTKYCSHFMKNQQCPKADCMYLHELGDPEASFTKEEMHQGKHQEYEKRLHDALIATSGTSSAGGMGSGSICSGGGSGAGGGVNIISASAPMTSNGTATTTQATHSAHNKNSDNNKLGNGNAPSSSSTSVASSASSSMSTSSTSSTSSSSTSSSNDTSAAAAAAGASGNPQKDAWPSLSLSPVNNSSKESVTGGSNHSQSNGHRHTKNRREKKQEKNGRNKANKNGNNTGHGNNSNSNSSLTTNKENCHPHSHSNGTKETNTIITDEHNNSGGKTKAEKNKSLSSGRSSSSSIQQQKQQHQKEHQRRIISADDEVQLIQAADTQRDGSSSSSRNTADENDTHCNDNGTVVSDGQRSFSTSSSNSTDNTSTLSESTSGKSSPIAFSDHSNNNNNNTSDAVGTINHPAADTIEFETHQQQQQQQPTALMDGSNNASTRSDLHHTHTHHQQNHALSSNSESLSVADSVSLTPNAALNKENVAPINSVPENNVMTSFAVTKELQQNLTTPEDQQQASSNANSVNSITDTTAALSKLNIFDDNNSFFSSTASFQQSLLLKNKLEAEMRPTQLNSVISSHLPDLLNGIDGFQNNTANSNEWEEAFKNIMLRSNKQMEEQLIQQSPLHQHQHQQQHQQQQQEQQQQHQQQQLQEQEEFLRIQELQKRNNLLNNIGLSQMNGPHNDFPNNFSGTDLSRLSQTALIQHQQQMLQQQQQERLQQSAMYCTDHLLGNSLFGTNMSKFFDFHKNQQQQLNQQQFLVNGHTAGGSNGIGSPLSDHLRMASLLENNRINSQFLDKSLNGLVTPQQQQQQQQLQQTQQLQKQRLLGNKFDPLLPPQQQQQQLQSQNTPQQQQQQQQQPQVRLQNQFTHNSSVDDDLGFDPFIETQKALAELMENEMVQQQNTNTPGGNSATNSTAVAKKILQQQQQQQQHHHQHQHQIPQHHHPQQQQLMDNMQRARMPPPGFNHMNAFGFGVPRAQGTSKILPFMNMNGNGSAGGGAAGQPTPTQIQMPPNSWNPNMAVASMQQQHHQHTLNSDPQLHMNLQQQQHNGGNHNKGYSSSNDWTAMDPAILSFRQFSSFPQQPQPQPQQPPIPHHPPQDLFLQHVTQQQQQQQQQHQNGFGTLAQSQLHTGGINMPPHSGLLNQQNPAAAAAQVNLSHSNWLSTEQSLFMNSLANGFTNNNFDKFSIPMPPGIHPSNLNKQQKTECIN